MTEVWGGRERWIGRYCSGHSILLVGEGDFSFSCCLALAFGSAINIVATSLDTFDELGKKYQNAHKNLKALGFLGAMLVHGVDTTQMRIHPELQSRKFDRIIYNFPHAGFHGKEDDPALIQMHRSLVHGFLINASGMLWPEGEIHVSHKTTAPFDSWKIVHLALDCSLLCIGQDAFRIQDYPGYQNKRGSGLRPDKPFPLGPCQTFRFKLIPHKSNHPKIETTSHNFRFPVSITRQRQQQQQLSGHWPCGLGVGPSPSDECRWIFGRYLDHVEEMFGSGVSNEDVCRGVGEALRVGYETYMGRCVGQTRPLRGYIGILEELRNWSILRAERLRQMLSRLDRMG